MNYNVEMSSGVMIYISRFIQIHIHEESKVISYAYFYFFFFKTRKVGYKGPYMKMYLRKASHRNYAKKKSSE
jgi:hypothetical protein